MASVVTASQLRLISEIKADSVAMSADDQLRDGLAIVDKAAGWTSHDVVAKARGILHNRKIGHSGTLDPDATGLLLLGVGRATRLLRFLTILPKTYVGDIVLGTETSTLDASGDIVATFEMSAVTLEQVRTTAARFVGEIMQIPPMVSAVKVGGRRLHQIAREGGEVEREPRPVTIHSLAIDDVVGLPGVFRATVTCSSGTYIRTLAADIGRALGGGAHLTNLRRIAIGTFELSDANPLDDIVVRPIADVMRDYSSVTVVGELAEAVAHGKVLDRLALGLGPNRGGELPPGPWAVCDQMGDLLAVYEAHRSGTVKPSVVVAPATGVSGAQS